MLVMRSHGDLWVSGVISFCAKNNVHRRHGGRRHWRPALLCFAQGKLARESPVPLAGPRQAARAMALPDFKGLRPGGRAMPRGGRGMRRRRVAALERVQQTAGQEGPSAPKKKTAPKAWAQRGARRRACARVQDKLREPEQSLTPPPTEASRASLAPFLRALPPPVS